MSRRLFDFAALADVHIVERPNVFGVLVTLEDRAWQVLILQEHVEVASLLRRLFAFGIIRLNKAHQATHRHNHPHAERLLAHSVCLTSSGAENCFIVSADETEAL